MKIASSTVAMESARQFVSYSQKKSMTLNMSAQEAASLEFSEDSKGLLEQMQEEKRKGQQTKEQERQMYQDWVREQKEAAEVPGENRQIISPVDLKLEILKRMLAALKRGKESSVPESFSEMRRLRQDYREGSMSFGRGLSLIGGEAVSASRGSGAGAAANTAKWVRTTVDSVFYTEAEHTAYEAEGIVKTADGREISFGVTVEMSRAFCQKYTSFTQEKYFCTDPLVINMDADVASVTDQKFLFDLDGDGKEENISFAGQGSGFLALDKNGDGKINDGKELFGPQSGNGFKDLAEYDKDGNGWIDENDDVFRDLKVWTKDEQGNDRLISLKEAGVGAIYLGSADTEFSHYNMDTNEKNGVTRSTGVYLKENGGAGTVQHVDLVV